MSQADARILAAYAERMSIRSVREQNPEWAQLGLLALAGAMGSDSDRRDVLPIASILWDALVRLKLDPHAEFLNAAAHLGNEGSSLIAFAARSDADRTIQAMGYGVAESEDGFTYRRSW